MSSIEVFGGIPTAFTEAQALDLSSKVAEQLGLKLTEVKLLSQTTAASAVLLVTPGRSLVARLQSASRWQDSAKETAIARWLRSQGAPVVDYVDPQPAPIQGVPITVTQFIPPADGEESKDFDFYDAGRLIGKLHNVVPRAADRPFDPLARSRLFLQQLKNTNCFPKEECSKLQGYFDKAEDLRSVYFGKEKIGSGKKCYTHGDYWRGNICNGVIFDLETIGVAPVEAGVAYDAIRMLHGVTRFGRPQKTLDDFIAGHKAVNAPPIDLSLVEKLESIAAIEVVIMQFYNGLSNPERLVEGRKRLDTLDDPHKGWVPDPRGTHSLATPAASSTRKLPGSLGKRVHMTDPRHGGSPFPRGSRPRRSP